MKIDLHVHSGFSRRPAIWLLQKLGCPESFTEPETIYRICKARGMRYVTLTDHNTIEGCLAIEHLPDSFISEEVTTYFPDSRCKIHVLVYNHNEEVHREIQSVRENIYDLVACLQSHGVWHAVAHPLSAVNDRLQLEQFEQLLLLFKAIELNGDQNPRVNEVLRHILGVLTPETIEQLADKHDIRPHFAEPWRKVLIAGSDDHSSLNMAHTYTRVPGAATVDEFFQGIGEGRSEVSLAPCSPQTMARSVYAIAYAFAKTKFDIAPWVTRDAFLRYVEHALNPSASHKEGLWTRLCQTFTRRRSLGRVPAPGASLIALLRHEANRQIEDDPTLMQIVRHSTDAGDQNDHLWFAFVNRVANRVLAATGHQLMDRLLNGQVFDVFSSLGRSGALYSLLSPYFVAYGMHATERELSKNIASSFIASNSGGSPHEAEARVGHFTDTFYEVNGVARTLQQWAQSASRLDKSLTLITCHSAPGESRVNVRNFDPVGTYDLPEYPEIKVMFPPFLEMLNYCYERNFTHIHAATPGPMGLAALAISRILKRPCYSTYHTSLPQYADVLTEDVSMGHLMWQYTLWFYAQMDVVFVNSRASAEELIEKGLNEERIRIIPRGVDTGRFHPDYDMDLLSTRYDVPRCRRLLYVGRVSKEKNLPLLVEAFKKVRSGLPDVHLVVVGDGPWLAEMKQALADEPCTFTGYLQGDELPAVYTECDLFVFPSTTDTLGNVVLEAQACGVPVIVSDVGGPHENLADGETGLVTEANNCDSLTTAMLSLLHDTERRNSMAHACRPWVESRDFDTAFSGMWEFYSGTQADEESTATVPTPDLERLAEQIREPAAVG